MADYDASMINPISGRESVRARPGMYVGSPGEYGKFHLALEMLGNAVDLFLRGAATTVAVLVHDDHSLEVTDDGPGFDLRQAEVRRWFEELSARGTADGHVPHVHLGQWGVGMSVANFLSEKLRIETTYGSDRLAVEWTDGGETCSAVAVDEPASVGTSVRLWFDREIFDSAEFPVERLRNRLIELAGLLPGLNIQLNGEAWLFREWQPALASVAGTATERASCEWTEVVDEVDIHIQMVLLPPLESEAQENPMVFANYLRMDEKGAFTKQLEEELELLSTTGNLDYRTVVSLTMAGPQISGPTRSRLDDQRTVTALDSMLSEHRTLLRNVLASEDRG